MIITVNAIDEVLLEKILFDKEPFLLINSYGGETAIASSVSELLKTKNSSACIVGGCASAATNLFFSCKRRYSLKNLVLQFHRPEMDTYNNFSYSSNKIDAYSSHIRKYEAEVFNTLKNVPSKYRSLYQNNGAVYVPVEEASSKSMKVITVKELTQITERFDQVQ